MKSKTLLLLIVIIGIFFRFYNVNWDQNFHLHPDERFLTMVGVKETIPLSLTQYFDPLSSPLNPSVIGFSFFVYGVLPLTLNFFVSILLNTHTYDLFTIQGRMISALFDIFSLLVVYRIASVLQRAFHFPPKIKYFSAFFYAISVLPIQLSHFFTVDIFLSFFMLLSFYLLLLHIMNKNTLSLIFSGIFLGLALACKISAAAIIPLELLLLILAYLENKKIDTSFFIALLIFTFATYCSVRISDPYLFASGNFFDMRINQTFLESIQSLSQLGSPGVWYPPNIQWHDKFPVIFSLINIAFFGLGIGYFIFMFLGIIHVVKTRKVILISVIAWVLLFFFYQSIQYVKTMRYFIFLYPFFAILAGIGFAEFIKKKSTTIIIISIILIVIWPISFLSIYTKPHTRVTASDWIHTHLPSNSIILGEYWDDPLPLTNKKGFVITLLHVFDPDTKEKWDTLNNQLQTGEYLVLSSNRGWGSITTNKNAYPRMSKWYEDLFAGKLAYQKIAEFTSFPSLSYLGIPLTISDTFAEEAFTVYDHPVVMIFQKK